MDAKTSTASQFIRSYPFRIGVFGLVNFAVFECVYRATRAYGAHAVGAENGPIETSQVILALVAATAFFCAAHWSKAGRACLVTAGAVVAYAAARESDRFFETVFFDDAYKWLVGLPMAMLVVTVVIADRHRLLDDAMSLMRHPSASLFVIAGVFLCFACQTLDRPGMWTGITDVQQAESTKALIEEYAELFAYMLLAYSGIEAVLHARHGREIAQQEAEPTQSIQVCQVAA